MHERQPLILRCDSITKCYGSGSAAEHALRGVSLTVSSGEACVLLGPSGSGKTTLLSILGCMLSPSSGTLSIAGEVVAHRSKSLLGHLRRSLIGFVFQHAQLLPFLSVQDNLAVAGENAGVRGRELCSRINELSRRLGIEGIQKRRPNELSGGQRQRVAVARALVHRPLVLLADEPTAALDWQNGEAVVRLLTEQAKEQNAALVVVTHDRRLIKMFNRVFHMNGGRLEEQPQ